MAKTQSLTLKLENTFLLAYLTMEKPGGIRTHKHVKFKPPEMLYLKTKYIHQNIQYHGLQILLTITLHCSRGRGGATSKFQVQMLKKIILRMTYARNSQKE